MDPAYTIRPAHPDELHLLPGIELAAGKLFEQAGWDNVMALEDVTSEDAFHDYFNAGRLWVAAGPDDQPVGFAAVSIVDEHAHLDEIDVHPDHGRRGIGAALVEHVCAWARETGWPAVSLTTERDLPWNAPFYARHAFVILAPEQWTAGIRAIVAEEIERGLFFESRVVMIRKL
ncbi:MAG: GNAT family N-acetyltransferase [Anaerolineae bacterium]|nr:GNAT family N-acetyltransferase [Anaerolineae bacterium]